MAKVILCGMHRIELDGDVGVQLEFLEEITGSKAPQIVPVPKDEHDIGAVVGTIIQGTMTAIQQSGAMGSRQRRPKMILFLTEREYRDMGSPQINDLLDMTFTTNKAISGDQALPGSIILLSKVDGEASQPPP